jgi:glycerol kinase
MTGKHCVIAIDQGTTSSRAIAFGPHCEVICLAQQEFPQIYPASGWVEHDPEAIWSSTIEAARRAISGAEAGGYHVAAIGVTNQRETTLLWRRSDGRPVHNAIVWQDRRTAESCRRFVEQGLEPEFQSRTGLLLDPYFSCSKLAWLLDHVDRARSHADNGDLAFGTVDSFLLWRMTGGRVHATDATNASRTGFFNIHTGHWDDELLRTFGIPAATLPDVRDCAADFGVTDPGLFGRPIPITGLAGDQQAAAIGQCCFAPGAIKSTYGTGCFLLFNTGADAVRSDNRLLTTIAYRLDGCTAYALEGSIFVAGAAVQWLRDGLGVIGHAADTEGLASGLPGNQGVYLVPAFTGLGAPHWNPDARGALFGLTRATGPAELARAALESVCFQTHDLLAAMGHDRLAPGTLRVDGGMVGNDWMVQFLADILNLPVDRPKIMETSALGAAWLAGSRVGFYGSADEFSRLWQRNRRFEPRLPADEREVLLSAWADAVARVNLPPVGAGGAPDID